MNERMLVLAKAYPNISSRYQELICVAGITESGDLRRIYPVPWRLFWANQGFSKKQWIEYRIVGTPEKDRRPESIKIDQNSIKKLQLASFREIKKMISPLLTNAEELAAKFKQDEKSLGFVRPSLIDLVESERDVEKFDEMEKQLTLLGDSAVRIDVIPVKLSYNYQCMDNAGKTCGYTHNHMCEDWEMGALYRKYMEDRKTAYEKTKDAFLNKMISRPECYFMIGTHYRWKTPIIVSVIYPTKKDIAS